MVFQWGREIQAPGTARSLEFLMTADYAYCSSSAGANTRRYHGLFVRDGRVLLAGLDERLNGVQVSTQQYEGADNSAGLSYLVSFSVYPPTWVYWINGCMLTKTVIFDNLGLRIVYDISGSADLWVRPLITDRPVNDLARDPIAACFDEPDGFRWNHLVFSGDLPYKSHPETYWNVWYQNEQERGYNAVEGLYSPGVYEGHIQNATVMFRCTPDTPNPSRTISTRSPQTDPEWLEWAADAFMQRDELFAGYHWFCESWGRDSAISVTGLLTDRGRKESAQAVLHRLADKEKNGLIPNRFPENYHSSDASLWFIHALVQYRRRWGDDLFIEKTKPVIERILLNYPSSDVAALDHNLIAVVPQSTWMDTAFTPRKGKPVEINALWVQALHEADSMGIQTPVDPAAALSAFRQFWNESSGCLYDMIDPLDSSIRPNQLIALALGIIDQNRATRALNTITKLLLTPYGLRSLAPSDPAYQGRYNGDLSYHNGCVWPWLTGYYCQVLLRHGVSREKARFVLAPILQHLKEAGVGYISEIFDGDFPFLPHGCIAQAWSVAEISRAYRMVY